MLINVLVILGEGNIEDFSKEFRWKDKQELLDDYVNMIKMVADEKRVIYINMREAFLSALQKKHDKEPKGYITVDGEHPNDKGTGIMVDLFGAALRTYFKQHPKLKNDVAATGAAAS